MDPDPDIIEKFEKRKKLKLRLLAGGSLVIAIGVLVLIFGPAGEPYGFAVGLWGFVMIAVGIGVYSRCPKCDGFLGRDFKSHCTHCGIPLRKT